MMAGPFNWLRGHQAEGRLVRATSSDSAWSVATEHRGYAKRYGIVHRRSLEGLRPGSFQLTDRIESGHANVTFRWSLLIAPGLDVVSTTEGWVVHANGIDLVSLALPREWRMSAREESAWCSLAFGRIEPTSRLVVEGNVEKASSLQIGITLSTALKQVQNDSEAAI
jgi:hypothetical protein